MKSISFEQYFNKKDLLPLLDVRSPSEFFKGHVPHALSLPLFNDVERAEIGTLYKQQSKETALIKGLEIAGSKMAFYVKEAMGKIEGKEVAVQCWRGGKRSASIATLLEFMDYDVQLLQGGYKAYRNHVITSFYDRKIRIIVLGGKTGSGKTDVLKNLQEAGEQVIDLEGLANHKGSAFGALGEMPQPTTEQFENNLFEVFRKLDFTKRLWVENESKSIGKVFIPDGLWEQMRQGTLAEIEVPTEDRVERLVKEYGQFPQKDLIDSLNKISKRMGPNNVKRAADSFAAGDIAAATGIALNYYDKAYQLATDKKPFSKKFLLKTQNANPIKTATELLGLANEYDN